MSKVVKQAKQLLYQSNPEGALELANDVLEDDAQNLGALLIKGASQQALKQLNESVGTFKAAALIAKDNINVYKGLMRSYLDLKDLPSYFKNGKHCMYLILTHPDLESGRDASFTEIFKRVTANILRSALSWKQEEQISVVSSLQVPFDVVPTAYRNAGKESDEDEDTQKIEHDTIYEALVGLKLVRGDVVEQLIKTVQKSFNREISVIQGKLKQSLSYNQLKATNDKLAVIQNSRIKALLEHAIQTEDVDEVRRAHESSVLDLLVNQLELVITKAQLTKKPLDSNVNELRNEIYELCERMVMFAPIKPLCYELMWDWNMPSLDLPVIEKKSKRNDKKQNKKSKNKNGKENGKEKKEKESNKQESTSDDTTEKLSELQIEDDDNEASVYEHFITSFPQSDLSEVLSALTNPTLSVSQQAQKLRNFTSDSVFGRLLCAKFFTETQSYESALDSAHHGLNSLNKRVDVFGMNLHAAEVQFKLFMAQCYTYFQAPKNFGLASELYDFVLEHNENNTAEITSAASVGKGLIQSQLGKVDEAITLFSSVIEKDETNSQALSELSWLYGLKGDLDRAVTGLKQSLTLGNTPVKNAEIHWRIGKLLWDAGKRDQSCFNSFIHSLESSQSYAPAYTYLGLFYQDVLKDSQRAQRCFYRALELDNGQFLAGERLASDFANNSQWDLVEIVATTVLSSNKLRGKNLDWPYRAMGIVCINQLKFDEAVKYFQHCLRTQSKDVQAWVGLGESYIHSGRYNSAEKALNRALKINPEDFSAHYVLSLAQREVLNFPGSAESLKKAIEFSPKSSVQLAWALADNCLRASHYFYSQSRLEESLVELKRALGAIVDSMEALSSTSRTGTFWGLAAEAMLLVDKLGYKDISDLSPIIADEIKKLNVIASTQGSPSSDTVLGFAQLYAKIYVDTVVSAGSNKKGSSEKPLRVASLSVAALVAHRNGKIGDAIEFYKQAIDLESRNEALWNGYGVVLQTINPAVAQHCFIRALSIDGRNTDTWLNLAALYLTNGDPELALEACDRVLSMEPDMCRAWVTQALAESMLKSNTDNHIYRTLEHAYLLSENDEVASLALAFKEFELRPSQPTTQTLGALDKLLAVSNRLDNRSARLVMGLLLERRGDFESALEHLLEVEAWPHVARVQLALGRYADVLESTARSDPNASDNSRMAELSSLIVTGLAHFFLGDLDSSISVFTETLEGFETDPEIGEDVLRMLVEVLFSSNSEEAFQVAQEQLFMSIDQNGATLQVTMLLGAFGILSNDDAVKEAAREELRQLITPQLQGEMLGKACRILHLLDPTDGTYQRAVFQWPTDYNLWRHADKKQALIVAQGRTDPFQLSTALMEAGGLSNCQRAAFIDPISPDIQTALQQELQK